MGAFSLLEALLWDQGYQRVARHLERMAHSAAVFAYPFNHDAVLAALGELSGAFQAGLRYKARVALNSLGEITCEAAALEAQPPAARLTAILCDRRTDSTDRFLYHKTTRRALYEEEHRRAVARGHADVIFLNERGEVTEGAISNIFVKQGQRLLTPPVRCGLLPGIFRQSVLDERAGASEATLYLTDLAAAEEIYLCNAVRGWRRLDLLLP